MRQAVKQAVRTVEKAAGKDRREAGTGCPGARSIAVAAHPTVVIQP